MSVWYDYATVRVVPRVERGEFVNVGVILFSRQADYLSVRIEANWEAIRAIGTHVDEDVISVALEAIRRIARGDPSGGPIAALERPERFHWLTAPRSTIVQVSPVHTGCCDSPEAALNDLFDELVA